MYMDCNKWEKVQMLTAFLREQKNKTYCSFLRIKMDSVQSLSNTCKNYLLKIYSQHANFFNAIQNISL